MIKVDSNNTACFWPPSPVANTMDIMAKTGLHTKNVTKCKTGNQPQAGPYHSAHTIRLLCTPGTIASHSVSHFGF
jgi:hypothetical protein